MSVLTELISRPLAVVSLLSVIGLYVYKSFISTSKYPKNTPWVGRDSSQWLAELRANLRSFNSVLDLAKEGYHKYTKNGKSFYIPDVAGFPMMMLPRSSMQWVLDQPDEILSTAQAHYEMLGEDYAFTHKNILREPYHEHVIHKYLPRRLAALVQDLQDEVAVGFEDSWGTDTTEWREIKLYDSVMFMISRAVNRMIVGLPLCRNESFLESNRAFALAITGASFFIGHSPDWLKPIVGRLLTIPNNLYYRKCSKYTIPLIKERQENFERKKRDPNFKWEPPNDFISWTIMLTEAENRPDEGSTDMISRRIMPIEFASIHTSSISITHCLLDLISSNPSHGYLEAIRREAATILAENNGTWTKAGLSKCHRADSALRESLRVSTFMSRNIVRKVMPTEGITNPNEGWHAPKGTYIGFDLYNIQTDPDIYAKPMQYEAFRFTAPSENGMTTAPLKSGEDKDGKDGHSVTNLATTSDIWFPFSRGKHTCPGRFLIAMEIKMLLAYMTMNYDIEPLKKRPENQRVNQIILPPSDATIRVRRKQTTTKA